MPSIDIEKIKGDEKLRNDFITNYKPFIASCVYSIINRRVEYGVDEELSVALIAFNHAIDKFDGRGSFLSFSKLVIKNRLYDYYRSQSRHTDKNEPLYNDDETENLAVVDKSIKIYKGDDETNDLREEIEEFSRQLSQLNIKFSDLAKISPKHKAKRKKISGIVNFVLTNSEANTYFINSKNLPLKIIEDNFGVSRKNIEPYRKYIIALILIANSDFYYLKEYLSL